MDAAERLLRELQREVEEIERLRSRWRTLAEQRRSHDASSEAASTASRELWEQWHHIAARAERVLEQLRAGDASGVPWAIAFLEADPWFFRSGYMKGNYARLLRRFELSTNQRERLRAAILNNLHKGGRLEFGEVRRLARRLDTADFRKRVAKYLDHPDPGTRERAQLILESCSLNDQPGRDLRSAPWRVPR